MSVNIEIWEKGLAEKKKALAREEYELSQAKLSAKKDDEAWKETDNFMKKVLHAVNVRERDELSDFRDKVFRAFRQEMDEDYTKRELLELFDNEISYVQGEIEHLMLVKSDLEEFRKDLDKKELKFKKEK